MALTFLVGLILSKVGMIGGPVLLCIGGAYLFWRGFSHLALAAVIGAGVWFAAGLLVQQGVAICEARVAAAVTVERDRQAAANAAANDYQRGLVAGLLKGQRDLTATMKDNDNEAVSDPDAGSCGLSLGGVMRYDKLRRRAH